MTTYVALLRGINVGGHRKFPKADQLRMLEELGYANAQVYLHTGNWVFSTEENPLDVSETISRAIEKKYGWVVPVLVLPASYFAHIFNGCPFSEKIIEKSYFTVLAKVPALERIAVLKKYDFPGEQYHLSDYCIYFYPSHGAHKAKMSNNFFEDKLKVTATTRNYRTMVKLVELSQNN